MRIRGTRELRRAGRWLRSRFSGDGGLVLLYHRIADDAGDAVRDPFGLAVTPRRFAEHLAWLAARTTPMRLRRMTAALAAGELPRRAVAVTFDDGYADNLYAAQPLLERHQIPATVFVVSGTLGGSFWWEELTAALGGDEPSRRLELEAAGRRFVWKPTGDPTAGRRLLGALHRFLRPLDDTLRRALLAELSTQLGGERQAGGRPLTVAEIGRLAASEVVEIGAHSVSHPPLAQLSHAAQRREIEDSRRRLEELVATPVSSFSYPYGEAGDYGRETVTLVRRAGFERACTNLVDTLGRHADVWQLPRFWVGNWSAAELARRLDRWLPR